MKKIVLTALNAKYFHTNLAVRCLKVYAGEGYDTQIVERTINDNLDDVLEEIVMAQPDAVGFSCYIWNIEHIINIASNLKKVLPECFIFMGGPEVSFECEEFLEENNFVDMIIKGEGEITFSKWIAAFEKGEDYLGVNGTVVRSGKTIKDNTNINEIFDLNSLPFLYNDLTEYENKIIYFETSRGCPMMCAYCMSGNASELSYMDMDKIRYAFSYFLKHNVQQVKLVDRTFNFPLDRAKEILKMLILLKKEYPQSKTNFHFEITASIFDEKLYEIIKSAPRGLLQFEAGVQSTNKDTLKAISRGVENKAVLENISRIASLANVTVYADLIAGLPYEGYDSFKQSFNDVYNTGADKMHLGFLKVLKGSAIKQKAKEYSIEYSNKAPYKVIKTMDISYSELRRLEKIEHLVDRYKNSEIFYNTLPFVIANHNSPFDFFEGFAEYAQKTSFFKRNQSIVKLFDMIYEYTELKIFDCDTSKLKDMLMLDWATMEKPRRYPKCLTKPQNTDEKDFVRSFYNDAENINKYLPEYKGISPAQITRMCHIVFSIEGNEVYLIDYQKDKRNRVIKIASHKDS